MAVDKGRTAAAVNTIEQLQNRFMTFNLPAGQMNNSTVKLKSLYKVLSSSEMCAFYWSTVVEGFDGDQGRDILYTCPIFFFFFFFF